jgi:hypothetical protein
VPSDQADLIRTDGVVTLLPLHAACCMYKIFYRREHVSSFRHTGTEIFDVKNEVSIKRLRYSLFIPPSQNIKYIFVPGTCIIMFSLKDMRLLHYGSFYILACIQQFA